jgi:peptide/nickel transport system permease protein
MLMYSVRRLGSSVFVLLGATMLVFALASASVDPLAALRARQPPVSPAVLALKRHEYWLDRPLPARYWHWLSGVLRGDFGNNIDGQPVRPELLTRLGVTARLVLGAIVLAVLLAVVVGVISAVRANRLPDYAATTVTYLLVALPTFWFAVLLKEFLAVRINDWVGHKVLYTVGEESFGISSYGTPRQIFVDRLQHLALPTITLAAVFFAAWTRFQRAAMLDVLNADFMRLARAKGLTRRKVLIKHGLRNALIPITTIVAIGVGALLSGAVITEQVFSWHGLGEYILQSGIGRGDVNVIQAWLVLTAAFVIGCNLVADLLYGVLDPRIRL